MTQPLEQLIWLRIQADYITVQQGLPGAQYNGKIIGVPNTTILPTQDDDAGVLLGMRGYAVPADPGDVVQYIWVVRVGLDAETRDFINTIPGPGGWTDPALDQTRNVYRRYARRLINDGGMDPVYVRIMLADLFNAAKAELT